MRILVFLCGTPVTSCTNMDTAANSEKKSTRAKSFSHRPRSLSLTSMGSDSTKAPTQSAKVLLSKCPCNKSNETSWKVKCSACKQIWHTSCANLKTSKTLPENVVLQIEKQWTCPWCFRSPFLRPPGHPSCTNDNLLMGTVIADAVCEQVRDDVSNSILPEFQLSVDNLVKVRFKELSNSVEAHVKSIKQDIENLSTLKEQLLETTSNISAQPSGHITSTAHSHTLDENPTNHIEDYKESFLTANEVDELNEALGAMSFAIVNGRDVASFGEAYDYTGAPRVNSPEIPSCLTAIINKIHEQPQYNDEKINQVVVNKYTGSTHLPEHSDDEATIRPHSHILTVTLGQALPIIFKDKVCQREITLEPTEGSLYAMSMESQHHWSHRIEPVELPNNTRFSITFRSVGKNFRNSTIILGDSNTKHLKFSSGQRGEKGTFGYNMPGERVETFHIQQIDERKCMGYRNVIVHCGVNDIRDNSPGRQDSDPQPTDVEAHFNNLATKISAIKTHCPYASIVVNPLLPTKNQGLNKRILRFNSLIFEYLANDERGEGVRSTNLSGFVDEERGVLREEYGVWDTRTNAYSKRDILHLGRVGIRLLANVVRDSVQTKLVTSRSYSSTLTHHSRSHLGRNR